MKKKYYILLSVFMLFVFKSFVKAYDCIYYNESGLTLSSSGLSKEFKLYFDTSNKEIRGQWYNGVSEINALGDLGVDREYDSGYYIDLYDGQCPRKIYICKYESIHKYIAVINDNLLNKIIDTSYFWVERPKSYSHDDQWYELFESRDKCVAAHDKDDCDAHHVQASKFTNGWSATKTKREHCKQYEYTENGSTANKSSYEFSCSFYDSKREVIEKIVENYNNCKNSLCNESTIINDYNKEINELKTFCKSYISFMSVGDSCMDICINLKDHLDYDNLLITDKKVNEKCSMSEDIVSMIYNVFKWLRYIAPVLVIILSILDFIKAIAAQNDDDMKKAQGKFVKRLIVAALLFLIPLIINFALKTFGFYHSGCDITDLF